MLIENLVAELMRKYPIIQAEGEELVAKRFLELFVGILLIEHFARAKTLQELVDVFLTSLSGEKLSGGNIQKRNAPHTGVMRHCRQKRIAACVECFFVVGNTGCDQLRNTALHNFLGKLRVFELIADGHTISGAHQFRQIRIE